MPKVAQNNVDHVNGGTQRSGPRHEVYVNGQKAVVVGWIGDSHPPCPKPPIHCAGNWRMVEGSSVVFINGIPKCRAGDSASCGHVTSGTPNVFVG